MFVAHLLSETAPSTSALCSDSGSATKHRGCNYRDARLESIVSQARTGVSFVFRLQLSLDSGQVGVGPCNLRTSWASLHVKKGVIGQQSQTSGNCSHVAQVTVRANLGVQAQRSESHRERWKERGKV